MNEYEAQRREHAKQLVALGFDPLGQAVASAKTPFLVRHAHEQQLVTLGLDDGTVVTVFGRIMLKRDMGNLSFATIREGNDSIQIAFSKRKVDERTWKAQNLLDLGDIVAVTGNLGVTKTNELTVWVTSIDSVTKALRPPPSKLEGLQDTETRYRRRYADLYANPDSFGLLVMRIGITALLRQMMGNNDFFEVETPILQPLAGGAAAQPFTTHHKSLDIPLFLRIAPELYLKRLLVAGIPRVYEIGKNFRNEGISTKHNPEFTVMEAYEAFGNYETMMSLVEDLISRIVLALHKKYEVPQANEKVIDFTPPWPRLSMNELLHIHMNRTTMVPGDAVRCYETCIEPQLIQPHFVTHFPAEQVPLCKVASSPGDASMEGWGYSQVAENFELVIGGMEVGPGYTEQNDPDVQRRVFVDQQAKAITEGRAIENIDDDFIESLMHGMPPAGGVGIGIDRLAMLISGAPSVKEVMAFPLVRPLDE